ncbi:MAG: hypothetical protein JOZ78_21280 [Chroococcidiopsidaceae cyanobacterium CP_BM_ER_R8_30]|nr:hypothetical protein [Chroococcidiopsidaceae cyanobacterium CP_BM_ER_R8_30]
MVGKRVVATYGMAVVISTFVAPLVARATPVNVVELTATQIEKDLAAKTYTDQNLVSSYLDRINTYNPTYNAFTYINPNALQEAATVDATLNADGGVIPSNEPLLGVPIVVKDSMNIAEVRTTGGYSGFTSENGGVDMIPAGGDFQPVQWCERAI